MSNDDLLSEFLTDSYFQNTLTLITKTITRVKGRTETTGTVEVPISGIIQAISAKELVNEGLGQYTDKLSYSFFAQITIDLSENNFIRFEDKLFKIRKVFRWNNYGFNKYIICQYNDEALNDN